MSQQLIREGKSLKVTTNGIVDYLSLGDIETISPFKSGGFIVVINFYKDVNNDFERDTISFNLKNITNQPTWINTSEGLNIAVSDINLWKTQSEEISILEAIDVDGSEFNTNGQLLVWNNSLSLFEPGLISSENLGTNDLVSTSKIRKYTLFGNNTDCYLGIYSLSNDLNFLVDGLGRANLRGRFVAGFPNTLNSTWGHVLAAPVGATKAFSVLSEGGATFLFDISQNGRFGIGQLGIATQGFGHNGSNHYLYDLNNNNGLVIGENTSIASGIGLQFNSGDYKVGYSGLHSYIMGGGLITDGFAWKTSAGVERMRLDGIGRLKVSDRVGINGAEASGFYGLNMLGNLNTDGNISFGSTLQFQQSGFSQMICTGFKLESKFAGGFTWGTDSTINLKLNSAGVLNHAAMPTYANNVDALAGGLVFGDEYKTATGERRIVI